MAENIKGLTVVLGADTTALGKALADVNKNSRNIQKELKEVDKLLKLDPSNTELLAQKQKLLTDAVENTTEKLNRLKKAQEQVNDQFAKGEISEGQYRAFQREVAKTEQELKQYESTLKGTANETKKLEKETDKAKKSISEIGDSVSNVGNKLSLGLTAPLVAGFTLATETTREFRQDLAKLDTNAELAGQSLEGVHEELKNLNAITGETDSNIEALSNLMQVGFTGEKLSQVVNELSGAVIKFPDTLKIEGLADGLQETLATGKAIGPFSELLERMGVDLEVFDAGLASATTEAEKQNYVLQQLASLGLAEVNEQFRENNKELIAHADAQYDFQTQLAELGAMLEPILTTVISKVTELLSWFNSLGGESQGMILMFSGIAAAIGPVLSVIGNVISVVSKLGPVLAALSGPVGWIIGAIAGITAGLVVLYNKNDEFRTFVNETWKQIKVLFQQVWEEIVSFVQPLVEDFTSFLKGTFEELKAFWEKYGEAIIAFIKPWLTGIVGFFKVQFEGLKMLIDVAWTLIKAIIKTAMEAIKLVISNVLDIVTGLFKVFTKVLQGDWKGAWEEIKNTAKNIMENIVTFFKNIDLLQVGKDIINGLIKGIGSMASKVAETVQGITDGIKNGIKEALKINSPSKVTEELGEWTGEGLAEGMRNSISSISQQAKQLASAAVPQMQQATAHTTTQPISLEGFMSGAVFNVRSEHDIKAIAREIFNLQQNAMRGAGIS